MANPTPPISMPPEHAIGSDEEAGGGTNDDNAVACVQYQHYSNTAAVRAPPRLELEVDEPLLRLIRFMRNVVAHAAEVDLPQAEEEDDADEGEGEPAKKKRKKGRRRLRRVSVRSLQLGQRKIARTDELDIVAKFLYKKPKKIVCQLRRHDAYLKINVAWSSIQAIRACFESARFDTLKFEVKSSSEQYRADRPPPGMHIQWRRWQDLTTRTFRLEFEKGTLEWSYGKMLYTDPSLILLTRPPPPGGNDEEEEEAQAANTQQTQMITNAVPVAPSVDVESVMPTTRMLGSTATGGNLATHEYGGTQLYDSSELSHTHSLYR